LITYLHCDFHGIRYVFRSFFNVLRESAPLLKWKLGRPKVAGEAKDDLLNLIDKYSIIEFLLYFAFTFDVFVTKPPHFGGPSWPPSFPLIRHRPGLPARRGLRRFVAVIRF